MVMLPRAPGFNVKKQDRTARDAGAGCAEAHGTVQLQAIDPSLRHTAASCLQREQPIVLSKICPVCSRKIPKTSRKAICMMCASPPFSFALAFSGVVAEVDLSQVLNSNGDFCRF